MMQVSCQNSFGKAYLKGVQLDPSCALTGVKITSCTNKSVNTERRLRIVNLNSAVSLYLLTMTEKPHTCKNHINTV